MFVGQFEGNSSPEKAHALFLLYLLTADRKGGGNMISVGPVASAAAKRSAMFGPDLDPREWLRCKCGMNSPLEAVEEREDILFKCGPNLLN